MNLLALFELILTFLEKKRVIFLLLITIFFVILGANTIHRGGKPPYRTDFTVFLRGAEAFHDKINHYDIKTERQWNYVYLPLLGTLLIPFLSLPFKLNLILWYALSIACLIGTFLIAIRLSKDHKEGFIAATLSMLFILPTLLNTLTRGQLGVITLFLAVSVFYLQDKKKDFWAGFLLAFAVVLKSSPLLLLGFFFLFKKKWLACLGGIMGVFVFLILYPSLWVGLKTNLFYIGEYLKIMKHAVSNDGINGILWSQVMTPFAEDNQSLYAVLTRLYWGSEDAYRLVLNNNVIRLVSNTLLVLGVIALGILSIGTRNNKSMSFELAQFSIFPMLMLLFSPVAQPHHYTVLFLPIFAAYLITKQSTSRETLWLQIGILASAFTFLFSLISDEVAYWGLSAWGSFFFCFILIIILFRNSKKYRIKN